MERTKNILIKYLIILVITQCNFYTTHAQDKISNSYRESIFLSYQYGDMISWGNIIMEIENNPQYSITTGNIKNLTELLNYYYGYTGYLISIRDKREANRCISKGEEIIEAILSKDENNSVFLSYQAAFLGFRIALSNFKAITLGVRSIKLSNRAYEIDPNCFNANLEKANILNYSPKFVGGDKQESLKYYLKALSIYISKNSKKDDWNYLSLRATIINLMIELKELTNAKKEIDQLLSEYPNFKWAKDEIYPNLKKLLK